MAAIPQREASLKDVVASILPQCDELNIYLNNWDHTPKWLTHPKINAFRSEQEIGDLGDVGKFYKVAEREGYIFTVDDDFIYPSDYAARFIQAIEQYKRKVVVSIHGRILKPNLTSYYRDFYRMFAACHNVPIDSWVHEIGTGVTAWHSDTIKVHLGMFPYSNMSDILLSMEFQKAKIPMLVIAHKANWIRGATKHDPSYGIYYSVRNNDTMVTKMVNDFNWQLHEVK